MGPPWNRVFPFLADRGGGNRQELLFPDYSLCSLLSQTGKGKIIAKVRNRRYESEQNPWALTTLRVSWNSAFRPTLLGTGHFDMLCADLELKREVSVLEAFNKKGKLNYNLRQIPGYNKNI